MSRALSAWRVASIVFTLGLTGACRDAGSAADVAAGSGRARADGQDFAAARARAVKLQDSGAEPSKTLDALLAAWRLEPDHYGINHRLGRFYSESGMQEQSLNHFRRALAARPDDLGTLLDIVKIEVRCGRFDEALERLPRLEQDSQRLGEARYLRAKILDQRGERDAAENLVQDLSGLTPVQAYFCESLHGRFLLEAGDLSGAQRCFRAALDARPDYKEALKGLADSCRRQGDDTTAATWDSVLKQFIELTDNVYMRSPEDGPRRRELLEKLLADYPAWKDGFPQLADLQLGLGDRAAACRTVETFLTVHGAGMPPEAIAPLRQRYCGMTAK